MRKEKGIKKLIKMKTEAIKINDILALKNNKNEK